MAATTESYLRPRETRGTTEEEILKLCWKDLGATQTSGEKIFKLYQTDLGPTPTIGVEILNLHLKDLGLKVDDRDLHSVASLCKGFEGGDLRLLCSEAGMLGVHRLYPFIPKDRELLALLGSISSDHIKVNVEDFVKAKAIALERIRSDLDIVVPKVTWDDIVGLKDAKCGLERYLFLAITKLVGSCPTPGVLLYGPNGCGKTSLVKAAAHAAKLSLFRLRGRMLFSTERGEELIRRTFQVARLAPPSIIFFEHMDSICIKSGDRAYGIGEYTAEHLSHAQRMLHVFLTEMRGLRDAQGVIVLATIQAYDESLLNKGGGPFGVALPVRPPDLQERQEILNIKSKQMNLAADVDLEYIAQKTESFTGANMEWICRQAGRIAYEESFTAANMEWSCGQASYEEDQSTCISMDHFKLALDFVKDLIEDYDTTARK